MAIFAVLLAVCLAANETADTEHTQTPADADKIHGVPATQLVPGPLEPGCSRRLEVLGFADNEQAVALLQHVRCPVGTRGTAQLTDSYDLIDLMEARGRTVLARYQASPISRTQTGQKPVFVPPGVLASTHPLWRRAEPLHKWVKIKRAGHFRLRKHDFKDVMVRVRLDADSPMDVRAEGTRLLLLAPQDAPIGCTAVGRLVDGSEVDLGHVRDAAPKMGTGARKAARGQAGKHVPRGHLRVVFSAHGRLVVLEHHGRRQDTLTLTRTRHDDPIASTQVGFLQMLKWDADSVKEVYGDLHPDSKKVWDEMVGDVE